jgi:hypothetical protein
LFPEGDLDSIDNPWTEFACSTILLKHENQEKKQPACLLASQHYQQDNKNKMYLTLFN